MNVANVKGILGGAYKVAGGILLGAILAGCAGAAGPASPSGSPASGQPAAGSKPASASASASASATAQAAANGQLGMIFEVNNAGWQQLLGVPAQRGMVVAMVIPNQPGAKAGVQLGDIVTKMNGVDVFNANVANMQIRKLKVGEKVTLDLQRKTGPAKVDVTVEPAQQLDMAALLTDQVNKEPNNARGYFLRGSYADKDAKSAVADYDKTIQLSPNFVSAYVQRATLEQQSNSDAALKDFDKAISLDPNYEPTYVNRSVLYSEKKSYDQALQDDQKAVQLDPTDPAALTNLGIGYVNKGQPAQGLDAENKALQIDPQFGAALLYRGLIYRDSSKADLTGAVQLVRDPKLRALAQTTLQKMS